VSNNFQLFNGKEHFEAFKFIPFQTDKKQFSYT